MPSVSVIIPVYNGQNHINNTVKEVLKQTLTDFEVICVDDGSTDGTWGSLLDLTIIDRRVRVFQKENGGAGSARNLGLQKSLGEYVFFLDSDDEIYNYGTLEDLYKAAKDNNAFICGGSLTFKQNDILHVVNETNLGKSRYIDYIDCQSISFFTRFIYKLDFLIENDLFFPNLCVCEDPVFIVKCMLAAKKFYYIDQIVYIYDQKHQETLNLNEKQLLDYFTGLTEILEISSKHGLEYVHKYSFSILAYKLSSKVINCLPSDNIELFKAIIRAESAIDIKLLKSAGLEIESGFVFSVLEYIWSTSNQYNKLKKRPFDFLKHATKTKYLCLIDRKLLK